MVGLYENKAYSVHPAGAGLIIAVMAKERAPHFVFGDFRAFLVARLTILDFLNGPFHVEFKNIQFSIIGSNLD